MNNLCWDGHHMANITVVGIDEYSMMSHRQGAQNWSIMATSGLKSA